MPQSHNHTALYQGKGERTWGQGREIKDVLCKWFIWVRLPGLISLLTICITKEVRGPVGVSMCQGPIHVQWKSLPHNAHQFPFAQMCQWELKVGEVEASLQQSTTATQPNPCCCLTGTREGSRCWCVWSVAYLGCTAALKLPSIRRN